MKQSSHIFRPMSRRRMLRMAANGFGSLALTGLMHQEIFGKDAPSKLAGNSPLLDQGPHYSPKAKSIIFIFLSGGMSHIDTFDPKPRLIKEHGEDPGKKYKLDPTQFNENGTIMASPWEFRQYGESGIWVSDLFPNIATCVDDIALIRSMYADLPEHANANFIMHTGMSDRGSPSMGAWINYGLGSENQNLPGFVVVHGGSMPLGGIDMLKSGYLPVSYQASLLKAQGEPLANIQPQEEEQLLQLAKLKYLSKADKRLLDHMGPVDELESAIRNYELAFRMQASVPELSDISGETKATKQLYGFDSQDEHTRNYAAQCLLARRLVERGVRFVEITDPFPGNPNPWDQHGNLKKDHERNAHAIDQPIAGLLKDLKARGLLEETLVVFATEFGRTFFAQGTHGRDHNTTAFSIWLAGAGIKAGTIYGSSDEYGYRVLENKTTIPDLHATMLHLLGIDHKRLTYPFKGRDVRLTDVHGELIEGILA
ncbi:MAG: DUF1501 domain-containing protein [Bacteroidota bacterium]